MLSKLNADNTGEIVMEVAYASPSEQLIISVHLPKTATAKDAIEASGILLKFPEIDLTINKIGIFGKLCKLEKPLRHYDRVEIYRQLTADPKQLRRQSAEKKR
jgi:putative ubiquitin-RnfH superfamily antitoxin RatB of RatAB toxin-antitoxin module